MQQDEKVRRALVLCGPGNNGGDGFVVARLLKARGWEVEVFLYGDVEKLPPDAKANYNRWLEVGQVTANSNLSRAYMTRKAALVIDAVFGTGFSRPLAGDARAFCLEMFKAGIDVAIDVPSGFCSDSGKFLDAETGFFDRPSEVGSKVGSEVGLIVTFETKKTGHELHPLASQAARIDCRPIGLKSFVPNRRRTPDIVELTGNFTRKAAHKDITEHLGEKMLHKYSHGHALILSGGPGHTGAARLAARGALRIGAGVVTFGVPPAAQLECAAQLTAIMLRPVGDGPALAKILADPRINALCLGPAMGIGENQAELLRVALTCGRATVLDADALTLLSQYAELFELLHDQCVLTPHAGEFARLFPDIAEKLNATPGKGPAYSKVDATREAAARANCVVLFKGADTVIAGPDGRCSVNSAHYDRAAPWLATAGSGDVLAGFITGLLARGFFPLQAAETGAWLHVECARHFGPGLIAEDLPEQLPGVLRALAIG